MIAKILRRYNLLNGEVSEPSIYCLTEAVVFMGYPAY